MQHDPILRRLRQQADDQHGSEEDADAPRSLVARLKELEASEAGLATELTHEPAPTVVRLPTNYEAHYARAVAELEAHLAYSDGIAARDAIRALVKRVVVQSGDARGGKRRPMQLEGDLFGMLALAGAGG